VTQRFSLNEIQSMAKRAARGSGCSWGIAEEAGFAARWLSKQGLPGVALMARTLQKPDGRRMVTSKPVWLSDAPICPLHGGAALLDRAKTLAQHRVTFGPTRDPVILAAFASGLSGMILQPVLLRFSNGTLCCDNGVLYGTLVHTAMTQEVIFEIAPNPDLPVLTTPDTGQDIDPADWAILEELAQNTYAPATDASRIAGAGAGTSDND
jgi:hypothetical protein